MRFAYAPASPADTKADLLAVACVEDTVADIPLVSELDSRLSASLRDEAQAALFRGKPGQAVTVHTQDRLPARRVSLIGVGPQAALGPAALRQFAAAAARQARAVGATTLGLVPPPAGPRSDRQPPVQALVEGALLGSYRFDRYVSSPDAKRPPDVAEIHLLGCEGGSAAEAAIARGVRRARAVAWARDLVNEPAGSLDPARLAAVTSQLAADHGLEIAVLGPEQCRERGMGLFLAVAQGSSAEPRFIHVSWRPPGKHKRVVLIGKGVTFDSGGLSLKPSDSMLDMKTDMAGAAAVLAAMAVVAEEKLPIEVHALAPCAENMISGRAYKLGDVLRSKAGKSVEITNTDAEGRLTLADALAYAIELDPDAIVDIATLTGACVVALGPHIAGVMSNNEDLQQRWLHAARAVGEDMWPLPLPDSLREQLKSDIADMKNTGERWGGALTAGLFLKEFVAQVPWVHVDIAGPASADKDAGPVVKGGTGFGVLTILEYLRRVVES
jgi:leucyl aminopeptidase